MILSFGVYLGKLHC